MNINIISDMLSTPSTAQPKDDLAVSDDLFQQLLQANNQALQHADKLPHATKQAIINDDAKADDLELNLDLVAMILPALEQVVAEPEPMQLLPASNQSKQSEQLNTRLVTTNVTTLAELNQVSEKLPVDINIDAEPALIINQPQAPLDLSTVNPMINHQLVQATTTPSAINNQLTEADITMATKPVNIETPTLTDTPSQHTNFTEGDSMLVAKSILVENHLTATTDSKPLPLNANTVDTLVPDNFVPSPQSSPASTSTSTTTMPQTMNLSMPVNINQWQTSLTQQIVMLNRHNIPTAEIKLHPQELGSLHIKLSMHEDNMNLHLLAAHATVKGVLESALPLLRTSLEQQGITLQQAEVSDFSMMNDSQQSPIFQQSKTHKPAKLSLVDDEPELVATPLSQAEVATGLSIFA